MKVMVLAIGAVPDHLHLLISLPPTQNLAKVVCDLKANSSKWMNETGVPFSWQQGYGAFSVSPSRVDNVQRYIGNQSEHHRKRTFDEEFLDLLEKSGIPFEAKYVFG
jgi:putative transposase